MSTDVKKICIIGLGYIGMPTAAMFAQHGFDVVGVDLNPKVVENLNKGKIIIEEEGLEDIVKAAVKSGKFRASTKPETADVFIISVGTPINEDKTSDMRAVIGATESIVPVVKQGDIVVLESTSPPGTVAHLMADILRKSGLDPVKDLYLAHSPERVIPGRILIELVQNDRIIGGLTKEAAEKVSALYKSFVKGEIYLTDSTTAEMCKLMENTFRDVNIALANELAKICEAMGINAWEVIKLSNRHPRVNIHQPGPGVGGHCIAVDPWFIVEKQPEIAKLIKLSRQTNDSMPYYVTEKVKSILSRKNIKAGAKVAIFGVTYKPDTDDMRESPIIILNELLKAQGFETACYDPHAKSDMVSTLEDTLKGADILVLGVNHKQFADIDFDQLKKLMRTPVILDTRNMWSGRDLDKLGFDYNLLGDGK